MDEPVTLPNDETETLKAIREALEQVLKDNKHNALKVMPVEHHEIHDGKHYFGDGFATKNADQSVLVGVQTPDTTTEIHLNFQVWSTDQMEVYVFEDSVFSGGTVMTPRNNNRNEEDAAEMLTWVDPTVSDYGTEIAGTSHGKAGTTAISGVQSGFSQRSNELILKRNTKYIFQAKSKAASNIISYLGNWYEHPPITTETYA